MEIESLFISWLLLRAHAENFARSFLWRWTKRILLVRNIELSIRKQLGSVAFCLA